MKGCFLKYLRNFGEKRIKMRMKISIAMAVYNGEKYLREQIDSILPQLLDNDELIISYDKSIDNSYEIIKEYVKKDSRVKCFENNIKPGVVKNFENAVNHCTGEIIFYSDQDDVWKDDKIIKVVEKFKNPNVSVVIHDSSLTDEKLNITHPSTFKMRNGNTLFIRNFIRLSYIGCCLAFRGNLKNVVLPIPTIHRSHDWWTGSICSCFGKMEKIDESLVLHRQHENNATPPKRPSFSYQVTVRWIILNNLVRRKINFKKRMKK